ncbi:hypothetical protein N0B51_02400 [Tsuneonella sp. YG55]|uniref:Uncharacterized protein n=1 Tax=Tsuneonella litorea TaxID=2976475 RepID=A0A9X2VZ46_9SPHN|nr:hypothetical protein [Tsuneonella litorea]MCT2557826.1 hypothetical protein [Tsuneonella litorea]
MAEMDFRDFQKEIVKLGFYSYDEQQSVFELAKRCAKTTGLSVGGAGAVMGAAGAGFGAAAGFLGGLVAGTAMCTAGSMLYREQIKEMLAAGK